MDKDKGILIADAGGTSTRWCLVGCDGVLKQDVGSVPVNVCVSSDEELSAALASVSSLLRSASELYFYGAGCAGTRECERLALCLRESGYDGIPEVYSDMTGAARALFGDKPGLACILGTGSNSCLYDGSGITDNIPPLGYILGDEGGGASIGKRFLKRLIRGDLPKDLSDEFFAREDLTVSDIYAKVYREPRANRFLAGFARFVHEHSDRPEMRAIAEESFAEFLSLIAHGYGDLRECPVGFVGSVAYYFDTLLRAVASRYGIKITDIELTPMDGLIRYHSGHKYKKTDK